MRIIQCMIKAVLMVVIISGSISIANAQPQVIAALGKTQVQGKDVIVEVLVVVQPGQNGLEVARAALAAQGAHPLSSTNLESEEFTTTGLIWDQFFDGDASNDFVIQNYNSTNEPDTLAGSGLTALLSTHTTWRDVTTSRFEFDPIVGFTSRCPSLVNECAGPQDFDGNNDIAWLSLDGITTLAVTWFGTTIDEADVAFNTDFPWANNAVNDFDIETVILHEIGHVAGLSHTNTAGAVMEAVYDGVRRTLHTDDINGITFLYPVTSASPAPVITGCDLISVSPGARLTVTISGSNFVTGATADFGERISVRRGTVIVNESNDQVQADIRVHRRAVGSRGVTITNPDGQTGSFGLCFNIDN